MRDAIERILYSGKNRATSDGSLEIRLSSDIVPNDDTNPVQLFAADWSASLPKSGAADSKLSIAVPEGSAIDAEVDLGVGVDAYGRCANNAIFHSGYRQCALQ